MNWHDWQFRYEFGGHLGTWYCSKCGQRYSGLNISQWFRPCPGPVVIDISELIKQNKKKEDPSCQESK